MERPKFVAYEQNLIMYNFLKSFVMSFGSGANHQASSAIASKQSFNVKKIPQLHFVHMLQTLPPPSDFEVPNVITAWLDIDSLIIEIYL